MGEANAIADTGPLVAYLDRRDGYHAWASDQIDRIKPPLLVCEPVLSKAMFLLGHHVEAREAVLTLVAKGALKIAFQVDQHLDQVRRLVGKYRSIPMSLADACIVAWRSSMAATLCGPSIPISGSTASTAGRRSPSFTPPSGRSIFQ